AFSGEALLIYSGARSHDPFGRGARQGRDESRSGRRIADAHLAEGDDSIVNPLRTSLRGGDHAEAEFDGPIRLRARHGRAVEEVGCAGANRTGDISAYPFGLDDRVGDTDVDDGDLRFGDSGHHVDRRPSGQEVAYHLTGDFLRIGADADLRDPVVGREDNDEDRTGDGPVSALDGGELLSDLQEAAQA